MEIINRRYTISRLDSTSLSMFRMLESVEGVNFSDYASAEKAVTKAHSKLKALARCDASSPLVGLEAPRFYPGTHLGPPTLDTQPWRLMRYFRSSSNLNLRSSNIHGSEHLQQLTSRASGWMKPLQKPLIDFFLNLASHSVDLPCGIHEDHCQQTTTNTWRIDDWTSSSSSAICIAMRGLSPGTKPSRRSESQKAIKIW